MRLDELPESSNVSDMRGMRTAGGIAAGGGGLLLLILGLVFGVDTSRLGIGTGESEGPPPNDNYAVFAKKVIGSLEAVWQKEFASRANGYGGAEFEPTKLILFSQAVNTGCGRAPSAVGPFYCPRDQHIYLDPTFFRELEGQLGGSKAQFSQAYVMAHEYGHHIQNLLDYSSRVRPNDNRASVRLELQADYLAGVWANKADREFHILEGGDLESAIQSANAIGDDTLQKRSGSGFTHPEKYTHGTSAQRVKAFTAGHRTGDATKGKLDRFFTAGMNSRGELDESLFR
jgi:predicted metalloprotease